MMKIFDTLPTKILGILFVILFVSGCAKSELNLELSIYKEDLHYSNALTQAKLKSTYVYLDSISSNVDAVVEMKKKLANDLYGIYRHYRFETYSASPKGKALTKKDINKNIDSNLAYLTRLRNEHITLLQADAIETKKLIALARSSADALQNILPTSANNIDFSHPASPATKAMQRAMRQELKLALNDVDQHINTLINSNDTAFQISLEQRWPSMIKRISSNDVKKKLSDTAFKNINKLVTNAANNILATNNEIIRIGQSAKIKLDTAVKTGNMTAALKTLVGENPFEVSEKLQAKQSTAVDPLNSQLERMQDPGSPVWRLVTAPENRKKWNKKFNRTYFFARGDSGVVIVRDSPMDYRIQEGTNNPAALVKAQLGVSRAIADAAIQMAGAATGSPLVIASLKSKKNITKNDNNNYQADSESLIRTKAALARKAELRRLAINAMTANLKSKLKQIDAANGNAATIQGLVKALINSLTARQGYFEDKKESANE